VRNSVTHAYSYGESNGDSDGYRDWNSDCQCYSNSHGDIDAKGDAHTTASPDAGASAVMLADSR
jgi:hypothetical protein